MTHFYNQEFLSDYVIDTQDYPRIIRMNAKDREKNDADMKSLFTQLKNKKRYENFLINYPKYDF